MDRSESQFYRILVVVDCEWSSWGYWPSWVDCFCDGTRYANRQIEIPPANGGDNCEGSQLKSESCTPTENCKQSTFDKFKRALLSRSSINRSKWHFHRQKQL